MGFIIDNNVINIKLTDAGRELLSRGELTFDQFAVGDSEIDYEFYNRINFDPSQATILRPKDDNPDIANFITRDVNGETLSPLNTVSNITSVITNTAPTRGFFDASGTTFSIKTDTNTVVQPNIRIESSDVTGTNQLRLRTSADYGANPTEPRVGDYLMVIWGNAIYNTSTVDFDVDTPLPYIWYKIERIISGTLASNNLIVELDKPTPDFNGTSFDCGAVVYPNNNNRAVSGTAIQSFYGSPNITDFVGEEVLTFFRNYECTNFDVPVWNLSIVFTDDIAGVKSIDKNISRYFTREYGGFVHYVQKLSPEVEKLAIIHYTNNLPNNNYGEGFVQNTPILNMPTIMWHKNVNQEMGLTLSGRTVTGDTTTLELPQLNTSYQDLVDTYGNVVGKVFLDMKLFVIEDQDLILAMSYKANRNWTLPAATAGFNVIDCPPSEVEIFAEVLE